MIIGLEGATWRVIRPMINKGELPNFKFLIENGAYGTVNSSTLSHDVWNNIAKDKANKIFWEIEDSYGTNYTSGSTIANISYGETWSSTKSLLVPSSTSAGVYYFKVNLNIDDYSSTVYDTFEVQVPVVTVSTIPTITGGIAQKKIANLEVLYDKELIIFPGIPKVYQIKIKNSGDLILHNLNLYLQGIELSWFSIEPNLVNLTSNESTTFKINYSVPLSAEIKKYPVSILVKSDEVEKIIYNTLNVITILDKTELENKLKNLEKEIADLEKEIVKLRDRGFPVDYLYTLLYNVKSKVILAKKELEIGNLIQASELIKQAEIIVDSIKKLISEITPIQTRIIWLVILTILIIITVYLLSVKFAKIKIKKLSKSIKIRKAEIEDLEKIKKMDEISLKAVHSLDYFKKNLKNILVAVEGEKIVGYVMFKDNIIMNLVVHPDYHEKGIGKILVEETMKKSKKIITRTREGNTNALEFFKHLGFNYKRKIEKYYKNGDNAIEMEWKKT